MQWENNECCLFNFLTSLLCVQKLQSKTQNACWERNRCTVSRLLNFYPQTQPKWFIIWTVGSKGVPIFQFPKFPWQQTVCLSKLFHLLRSMTSSTTLSASSRATATNSCVTAELKPARYERGTQFLRRLCILKLRSLLWAKRRAGGSGTQQFGCSGTKAVLARFNGRKLCVCAWCLWGCVGVLLQCRAACPKQRSKVRGGANFNNIWQSKSQYAFATVREMKSMDGKMALCRECCFPNCTKRWQIKLLS